MPISTRLDAFFRAILGSSGAQRFDLASDVTPTIDLTNLPGKPTGTPAVAFTLGSQIAVVGQRSFLGLWTDAPGGMTIDWCMIDTGGGATTADFVDVLQNVNSVQAATRTAHQMGGRMFDDLVVNTPAAGQSAASPFANVYLVEAAAPAIAQQAPVRTGFLTVASQNPTPLGIYQPPTGDAAAGNFYTAFATSAVNQAIRMAFGCTLYRVAPPWVTRQV